MLPVQVSWLLVASRNVSCCRLAPAIGSTAWHSHVGGDYRSLTITGDSGQCRKFSGGLRHLAVTLPALLRPAHLIAPPRLSPPLSTYPPTFFSCSLPLCALPSFPPCISFSFHCLLPTSITSFATSEAHLFLRQ